MPLPAEVSQPGQGRGHVLLGTFGPLSQRPEQAAQFLAGVRVQAGQHVAQLHARFHPVTGDGGAGGQLVTVAVGDVQVALPDEGTLSQPHRHPLVERGNLLVQRELDPHPVGLPGDRAHLADMHARDLDTARRHQVVDILQHRDSSVLATVDHRYPHTGTGGQVEHDREAPAEEHQDGHQPAQ